LWRTVLLPDSGANKMTGSGKNVLRLDVRFGLKAVAVVSALAVVVVLLDVWVRPIIWAVALAQWSKNAIGFSLTETRYR